MSHRATYKTELEGHQTRMRELAATASKAPHHLVRQMEDMAQGYSHLEAAFARLRQEKENIER